ncbi:calcium-transporting ATPase [Volvox carteri f. nagariensis]|uniref:Calcium-transporting ATPase n=1 Tax=Volvox carteri f. nagariensis TaxID=3068 RepID=D8U810_VOLCA|nr:calcium-transporting ATPase [Volvox carteri f. nagariensis]EFJ44186.1 calcium-transporting ATPase [Volvox carteri f. nagariensis]|eukprot:XP_002954780.1 calcium-transporting ATPase [Volvox carteri f. nagariensis]
MPPSAVAHGDVEAPAKELSPYRVGFEELTKANEEKDMEFYNRVGKAGGLARLLGSSPDRGLNPDPNATGHDSVSEHRRIFGANKHAEVPPKNFFVLVWEVVQDPILILLIAAAAVSTILGSAIPEERKKNHWIEGVAIWVAVIVVTLVGAGNDYSKDLQFRKLNAQKDRIQIKVIRGGEQILVENTDLVVGDIVILDTGDKVVADAIVLDSQGLTMDEASLTGESDPMKKNINEDPWVMSGTQVTEGSGHVLVIAVGPNSTWGKTMALVTEAGDDETPLQEKLGVLATAIGKIGFLVAVCCFIAQLIKWCVVNKGFPIKKINDNGPIQFFLYAITIIVVAVPEGLPLAVTISLAYSMKKMMTDNNFVRVLAACETMGGATAICSDKTGTLTENRMTVVEGWFGGKKYDQAPRSGDLQPELLEHLKMNCALNSKAFYTVEKDGKMAFVGNRTECALLLLMNRDLESDYKAYRTQHERSVEKIYGFTSAKKMASVLVRLGDKYRLYNKGAAEWVLKRCSRCITQAGVVEMTPALRGQLLDEVTAMAKRGLRCICLTYADFALVDPKRPADFFEDVDNVDNDLTCIGIVGIKDPVRTEVPDAVRTCKRAGITVRMVTGDNIHTARHIARECGILYDMGPGKPEPVAMEGPAFRDMLKEDSFVALRTEVSKEAADIVILDDNFSSIVKSVLWGRSVFANIRKFLQFQLTVNFVALVTAFVGAVAGGHEPLNILQLLWVNLIMDTMGALALATEDPHPALLLQRPNGRTEHLINWKMSKHIFVQGCYQMLWMFLCLYLLPMGPKGLERYLVHDKQTYYQLECANKAGRALSGKVNITAATLPNAVELACNAVSYCGFPYNASGGSCVLKNEWAPAAVPTDMGTALCKGAYGRNTTDCDRFQWVKAVDGYMDDEYKDYNEDEYKRPLSLLFNIFICTQVANEINARRINDEYNVFEGFFGNWIFLAVITITMGLQAIIINFLGLFFKVEPLDWQEWLASIAIGTGAWPVSFLTRLISRCTRVMYGQYFPTALEERFCHLRVSRVKSFGLVRQDSPYAPLRGCNAA